MVFHRLHGFAVTRFRLTGNAHHHRLRWSIDIGVENADLRALGRERQCQIDGCGRLANPPLAGGHCDDVLYVWQ